MKKVIIFSWILLAAMSSFAQATQAPKKGVTAQKVSLAPDGIVKREVVSTRTPIPYPYIREADVIWSRRIWRVIDLHERINLPLYYPTEEIQLRKSLIQTLVDAVHTGELRAFDPDADDEFTTLLSPGDISKRFDAVDKKERRQKMDGTGDTILTIHGAYNWSEVLEILVKEDWFFDRHYSKLFVRIVGICPVRAYKKVLNTAVSNTNESEDEGGEVTKKQLFWVHYGEARNVLARTPAYVPNNDATIVSFDDIFNNRRFASYIQKTSNPHNNRSIANYTRSGYSALLEAERIKAEITNWEHDLWEF
ncbi:gliding motility protein GldO [Bacteroidia bacterium]|nr:gliding motility protein GldO [Bacteroidia bacterium]